MDFACSLFGFDYLLKYNFMVTPRGHKPTAFSITKIVYSLIIKRLAIA